MYIRIPCAHTHVHQDPNMTAAVRSCPRGRPVAIDETLQAVAFYNFLIEDTWGCDCFSVCSATCKQCR